MQDLERGLGALPNPEDNRDIQLAMVQAPVALPEKYKTDLSKFPVEDQLKNGSCVGQAEGKAVEFFDEKETGEMTRVSKRYVYAKCKEIDGHAGEGTYPRIAAKILREKGAAKEALVGDNNKLPHAQFINVPDTEELTRDAYPRRVGGYAFVAATAGDLMQAIYQNGVVNASLRVGNWSRMPVKPEPYRGSHRIIIYGFEQRTYRGKDDVRFWFRNSWGEDWGKDGDGYFYWSDYEGQMRDVMVYTDIPNEILEEVKKERYIFTKTMKKGARGYEVEQLQRRLGIELASDGLPCFRWPSPTNQQYTTYFGVETEKAVQRYQIAQGIVSYGTPETTGFGQLGPSTRASLNEGAIEKQQLVPVVEEMKQQLITIMAAVGHPIRVTDAYRSCEEQNKLYAQGRTTPGNIVTNAKCGESLHNYRCAFDVAFEVGGSVTWDGPWDMCGEIGKALGFEWGGDWEGFQDRPHFQYTAGYSLEDFQQNRVDWTIFGVESSKIEDESYQLTSTNMKRVKSFMISFASVLLTAMIAVVLTPEWGTFVSDVYGWLGSAGVPASLIAVIGLVVAELWKGLINRHKINQYKGGGLAGVSRDRSLDLY